MHTSVDAVYKPHLLGKLTKEPALLARETSGATWLLLDYLSMLFPPLPNCVHPDNAVGYHLLSRWFIKMSIRLVGTLRGKMPCIKE